MDAVSGWALEGVELMRMTGIISGDEKGYFLPLVKRHAHKPQPFFTQLQGSDPARGNMNFIIL